MRREQVLKICLNFFLTNDIELKPKGENSWTFGAVDFSEGEFETHSFAIRFKTDEIAKEFKKAIEDALSNESSSPAKSNKSEENSKLVKKLQLPQNFFDYLNAEDCKGCVGCKSDDYVFKIHSKSSETPSLPENQPKLNIKSKTKQQNAEKHVSFSLNSEESQNTSINFGGIKKSDAASNIFAKFNEENPQPAANIFGTKSSFGQKPQENSIFSSSLNTTPTSTDAKVTFGMKPAENVGLFGAQSTFSFSTGATNGSIFGSENKESPFAGNPIFGSAQKTEPTTSIFGSGSKSFSFADAAKDLDNTKDPSKVSKNIFSSPSGFSFADAAKDIDKAASDKVPDFIAKSNDLGGFAALASNGNQTWATTNNSAPPGGFFGLTVKSDIFSKIATGEADTSQNDENANDDNYDPHYEPIISLPDEIKVSTGEEEETKVFGERAKIYRFDTNTREWKERGEN